MIDWLSVGIGVAAAIAFGALAIYLSVWKTPSSEALADFLVTVATRLLDAAVSALVKAMDNQVKRNDEYVEVNDAKLNKAVEAREVLRGYKHEN